MRAYAAHIHTPLRHILLLVDNTPYAQTQIRTQHMHTLLSTHPLRACTLARARSYAHAGTFNYNDKSHEG